MLFFSTKLHRPPKMWKVSQVWFIYNANNWFLESHWWRVGQTRAQFCAFQSWRSMVPRYDMDGYGKHTNFTQSEVSEIWLDTTWYVSYFRVSGIIAIEYLDQMGKHNLHETARSTINHGQPTHGRWKQSAWDGILGSKFHAHNLDTSKLLWEFHKVIYFMLIHYLRIIKNKKEKKPIFGLF